MHHAPNIGAPKYIKQILTDIKGEIDVYRAFHPKAAEYTFFPSAHETFSRIEHMLDQKTSLGKFKKIEIISSIFLTTML